MLEFFVLVVINTIIIAVIDLFLTKGKKNEDD